MKRLMGTIKGKAEDRRKSEEVMPQGDSPEAIVAREVTAFCESGGPNNTNAGDEYLHLPAIVDAAESSPAAATEAARRIRRFVSKDNHQRAYAQYNAIMLTRILTDNPAERFSKNFDAKFVTTIKELLREGRDMSVQQILRETLDYFETEKVAGNQSLLPLVEMWKKEKSKAGPRPYNNPQRGSRVLNAPAFGQQQQQQQQQQGQQQQAYFSRPSNRARGLPPPDELAARIEEAKTTARLLLQTIQSTPNSELLGNDLIKEFADRASSANRSIQGYINAENPAPDEDTMLTLIETNEQLSIAMSKHQRALLQARKAISATPSPQPQAQPGQTAYAQQDPQPQSGQNMYHVQPLQAGPGRNMYPTPLSLPPRAHEEAYIPAPVPQRREEEAYVPPAGPPPGAIGAVRNKEYPVRADNSAYAPPPPIPARSRPMSEEVATPTRTLDYGVADNPFDDTASEPQQPQQKSYSLFDRPSRTTPPLQSNAQYQENTQTIPSQEEPQKAYEPYNPGYRSTPSYVYRQESATNNLTMHGASPPPGEGQTNGMRRRPISPVEQVHDAQRRLGNMRV